MPILSEVLQANEAYAASFGDKAKLPLPPGRRFAILTCMDARLDPAKYAGLSEGDAHVIRNAGGRASDDAIRSLVISYKLLGTKEWFVIHHSDCGMQLFTDEIISGLLEQSLEAASIDEKRLARSWPWPRQRSRAFREVAHHQGPRRQRYRGCAPHPVASSGSTQYPNLWLYLRCADRASCCRTRSNRGGQGGLTGAVQRGRGCAAATRRQAGTTGAPAGPGAIRRDLRC